MQRVLEMGVNFEWGVFSQGIPGRNGYQCSNYWRSLINTGKVKDPMYYYENNKLCFFRRLCVRVANQNGIRKTISLPSGLDTDLKLMLHYGVKSEEMQAFKKFGFTILEDDSGVFGKQSELPQQHPKNPLNQLCCEPA